MLEFESYEDKEFLAAFVGIIKSNQNKNNTYKFALARFLLDYSRSCTEPSVRYRKIASYFFKYYWPQECKSKLRQGPPHQTPKIISIIRNKFDKPPYTDTFADIKRKFPREIKKCEKKIAKHCFDDVIHRFQKGGGNTEKKIFYDYFAIRYEGKSGNARMDKERGGILLNPDAMDFFRKNYEVLYCTVILYWVKFLEKINFGTPHLTNKVMGLSGVRNQSRFKKCLEPFATECFYCKISLGDVETNVEHVLSFNYMQETELWNLVLSCKTCNCDKKENLPPEEYIGKLVRRNGDCRIEMKGLRNSLYVLGTDHEQAVWQYYFNAKMQGFHVLKDFPRLKSTKL